MIQYGKILHSSRFSFGHLVCILIFRNRHHVSIISTEIIRDGDINFPIHAPIQYLSFSTDIKMIPFQCITSRNTFFI